MSVTGVDSEAVPAPVRPGLAGLLDELRWRGMLHATTPGLQARLEAGAPFSGYNGFDPTAESLHVGHLIPIMGLVHFQRRGGAPIALVGGGTGMIGDPSGRSSERVLLDLESLERNLAALRSQLERFLDFSPGMAQARVANNLDWLGKISLIEFLRDTGKHFTVPYMLAKDSVQIRLERGLSFTEFSYMLLQAHDFAHLYRTSGVELQMGGADQWGNITAGLELIRRTSGTAEGSESPAHALAYPLLLSPSGSKFGKSEGGDSIWLDRRQTTPFAFYQYWLNTDDRDVGVYLRWFTLFDWEHVEALEAAQAERPDRRSAQRALAADVTTRVHGADETSHVIRVSEAAFSREPIRDPAILATLHQALDGFWFTRADLDGRLVGFLVAAGLATSNAEARRLVAGGGLTINDERVSAADAAVPEPIADEWMVVRIGKRKVRVGRLRG